MRITASGFFALFLLSGCDAQEKGTTEPTQDQVAEAFAEQIRVSELRHDVLDGTNRKGIPYLRDFLTLYPDAVIRYLSFANADFPSLSVTTTLHDRYTFDMRVPVRYSEDNLKIVGYEGPRCHLLEIESVTRRGDELGGTSGGGLQKQFGEEEWKALVESKGDFSALGYELKADRPVPGFDLVIKCLKTLGRQIPNQTELGGAGQAPTRPESK